MTHDGARTKQKSRLHMSHAQNDARYVERGKMIHLAIPDNMDEELGQMNSGKNGHPFVYSECLVMAIIGIRLQLGIALRCAEGMAIAVLSDENAPDHVTLWRRTKSLDVSFTDRTLTVKSKSSILQLIIDGTGMSPSAKGDYIRCKYKIKTKSGFIRLSVMIQQDTMRVLGFTATDEKIGDSPQFEPLIRQALKSSGIDPDVRRAAVMEAGTEPSPEPIRIEIRADAGYDSRENFQTCKEYGITPIIKIRRNAEYTAKGVSRERGIAALDQLGGSITNLAKFHDMGIKERTENQNEWKKRAEYGPRWQVEIFFSAFKRVFGSSVRAKTMDNIIQEIALKIQRYNQFIDITQRVILMV